MIATVRIAPVEQWCEAPRKNLENFPGMAKTVGMAVEIDVGSMQVSAVLHDEPVRWWRATGESDIRLCQAAGMESRAEYFDFCEHMLEMD